MKKTPNSIHDIGRQFILVDDLCARENWSHFLRKYITTPYHIDHKYTQPNVLASGDAFQWTLKAC